MKFSVSVVGLLSAVLLSTGTSSSFAFGPVGTTPDQILTGSFGACNQTSRINGTFTTVAFTYLETTSPPQTYAPGGTIYNFGGSPLVVASPLTVAVLQSCADNGGLAGTVSNLVEYIADQTWETEDIYGFQWDFTEPDGRVYRYEQTMRGLTVTTSAISRTLISTPDASGPATTLSGAPKSFEAGKAFKVTVTFSENVTGFDRTDVGIVNGTVTEVTGGPAVYTLTVVPNGKGKVIISVGAGAAKDSANNDNVASNRLTISPQDQVGDAPAVELSGPASFGGSRPFMINAKFTEAVTGFEVSDVVVTNGQVSGISGGPQNYQLVITPTGKGDISVVVPEGSAKGQAGKANTVSNTLVIKDKVVEETQKAISRFMSQRANALVANQPELSGFLQSEGCDDATAGGTNAAGSVRACASTGDVWVAASGTWADKMSYALGTVGVHGYTSRNFIAGAMVQMDHSNDDLNGVSGKGWLAGPYVVLKHESQPLYLESRLLFGKSANDLNTDSGVQGKFDTSRMLAQAKVLGEYSWGSVGVQPYMSLTHTQDRQDEYTDKLGNVIGRQTFKLNQLAAGANVKVPMAVSVGKLDWIAGAGVIHSSIDLDGATKQKVDYEGTRGRVEFGLNYEWNKRNGLRARLVHDGLGTDYSASGLSLRWDTKF